MLPIPKNLKGKVLPILELEHKLFLDVYDAASEGITHVSMANYESREQEAMEMLNKSLDKVEEIHTFLKQKLYCNMIEGYFKNIHLISKIYTHRGYRVGKTNWYFTVDIWGNRSIRQIVVRGYRGINNLKTLGDFINFMINKKIPLVWEGA